VDTAISRGHYTEAPSGTVVAQQGCTWPYFSVVMAGGLEVTRSGRVRGQLARGNWFGNLRAECAPATLTATEDTLLAVFVLTEDPTRHNVLG
jgi:hypothetical protein